MGVMEIILLIAGGIIFTLSFFIPAKGEKVSEGSEKLAQEEIRQLVSQELEAVRSHVDEVVDEAVSYAMEKTERSLERLSNEKIMAVNEYSDTVLAEIHKNHEEAMFLYDMLNSKHVNLKNTVSEVDRTVKEAEEKVSTFRRLAPEAVEVPEKEDRAVSDGKADNTGNVGKMKTPKDGGKTKSTEKGRGVPEVKTMEPETAGRVSFMDETDEDGHNSNEKILELYKQGKSRVAIAKELGLGVGEVKLVLDLFKNQ
ncbi:MAG: DUF6115 domain-containing protein [Acetatifactor sp.]